MRQSKTFEKSFHPSLTKTFKNFSRLKNYIELTDKMLLDYNKIISEYQKINEDYINKLTQLSSKYESSINEYEKTLAYSDNKIKELLKLFHRIPSIFSLVKSKLSNIQTVINGNSINNTSINDTDEISKSLQKFEEFKKELETKEKKLNKNFTQYETCNKNLFDIYKVFEDSLANVILSGENKKIKMNEVFMKNSPIISERENEFLNANQTLIKSKKHYFHAYDKFFEFCEKKFKNTLVLIKSNISTLASVFLMYFKSSYNDMESIIKSISENDLKVDYSQFLKDLLGNADREIPLNKYVIRIVNEKYVEDKNKLFDHQKLRKENYTIKEDKIYLKNEDIYEIVKMMYAQLQFVDEKYYDLAEEQKKIKIKHLTDKLLSYSIKKEELFTLDETMTPIADDEVNHLLTLLNKPSYRFDFLKILNLFRAKGNCEMPKREFEITKNIFLFIADKIYKETDVLSSKLILILSQTFYVKENNEKIYLFAYLQNHLMFTNTTVWEKCLEETIQEDLGRSKVSGNDIDEEMEQKKSAIINNVLLAHAITFCHNMVEFGMREDNIRKIIDPLLKKYNLSETSIKQIQDIMQKELEGKDINK